MHIRVCVFLLVYVSRFSEKQGLLGGESQIMGGPERSVLPAEHGAEGRRTAGAQSGPLLHLRPDLLQTPFHRGDRSGGDGGNKGGGRSTACSVYIQKG